MEIVIAVFLGLWLMAASIFAFMQLKKDFSDILEDKDGNHQ